MKTRAASGSSIIDASWHLATLIFFGTVIAPAHADAPLTDTLLLPELAHGIPLDTLPGETPQPVGGGPGAAAGSAGNSGNLSQPQGNEMSVMAGVELERNDRRFRSRVVSWARNKSLVAGLATDFLLHGSDSGVHLDMQLRSSYVVRWRKRF